MLPQEHGFAVEVMIGVEREILVETSDEFPCPCKNQLEGTSDILVAII